MRGACRAASAEDGEEGTSWVPLGCGAFLVALSGKEVTYEQVPAKGIKLKWQLEGRYGTESWSCEKHNR